MHYTDGYNAHFHDGGIKETKNRMTDTVDIINNDLASGKIISKWTLGLQEKGHQYLGKCRLEMTPF